MEKILKAWNDIDNFDVEQARAFDAESGSYTYDDGRNDQRLHEAQDYLLNDATTQEFYEWLLDNNLLDEAVEVIRNNIKEIMK